MLWSMSRSLQSAHLFTSIPSEFYPCEDILTAILTIMLIDVFSTQSSMRPISIHPKGAMSPSVSDLDAFQQEYQASYT